jgi:glutathione synthase
VQAAIQDPSAYVLKPQREGGGNNLYGEELAARLQQGGGLAAYILMQRILPPPQRSLLVRLGACHEDETLSELGIYGTFLRAGQQVGRRHRVLLHAAAGRLLCLAGARRWGPAGTCAV